MKTDVVFQLCIDVAYEAELTEGIFASQREAMDAAQQKEDYCDYPAALEWRERTHPIDEQPGIEAKGGFFGRTYIIRWHSVDEIAAHLGVSRDTVYRWIDNRSLPAHKIGRLWKFKKTEVDEWVRTGHAENDRDSAPLRPSKSRS